MVELILPKSIKDKRKLEAKSQISLTVGLDKKTIFLKNKPLQDWLQFLEKVTSPDNPDRLHPAAVYVHQAFKDLVQFCIENGEQVACLLNQTSKMSSTSTDTSGSTIKDPLDNSQMNSFGESEKKT